MVFLGYSSIIEPYILKDNMYGQKTIKYLKFVSGTKNYRAGYMKMDENSYEEEVTQFDKDKKRKLKNENDFGKDEDGNMVELGENLI